MARRIVGLTIGLLLAGFVQARAEGPDHVSGIWLTAAGDAKIRISPCGGGLCGIIVWLKTPIDPATGKAQIDDKNPNKALAHRPIVGLDIFSAMRPAGGKWSGKIYNADNGKTYASELRSAGAKKLEVRGCVLSFLCGGETWTKVADLPAPQPPPVPAAVASVAGDTPAAPTAPAGQNKPAP
jgi:uncharacterized protein (DUF2147 family)